LLIAARYQWPYPEPALLSFSSSQYEPQLNQRSDAVKILIEKGADPNARDDAGRNALMVMSMEPRADEHLETAIEARKKIDQRLRLRRGDKIVESIAETPLNAGCDVNAADNKGRTPLIYAAASERLNVVELLLKRGANIHAKDHDGLSALDWAKKSGNEEIIRLLSSRIFSF
jgi:ankyrin repeat protein